MPPKRLHEQDENDTGKGSTHVKKIRTVREGDYDALWHNVDISNFQCHKNVNFHNNFVGLMIAD